MLFILLVQAVGKGHLSSVLVLIQHTTCRVVCLSLKHAEVARNICRSRVSHVGLGELVCHHRSCSGSLLRVALGLPYSNSSGLATTFDSLVAVFIMLLEIIKKVLVLLRDLAQLDKLDKHASEALQSLLMEVVLMSLHVAELRKGLVAIVEPTDKRLETFMRFFVGSDVSSLGERLTADAAGIWLFTSVTTHVSLFKVSL